MSAIAPRSVGTTTTPPDSVGLVRSDLWLSVLVAGITAGAAAARAVFGVTGAFHDDAIYVSTAKALAEGQGYRLIGLPDAPFQTKYPILYPAILALIWLIWPVFPQNVMVMQVFTLLTAGATYGLSYLYLVRFSYCSRRTAAVVVLVCGTAPYPLLLAGFTLTEMPFALLVVCALWRLEIEIRRPAHDRRGQFLTGLLISLPFLCRVIGITMIVAASVVLVLKKRVSTALASGVLLVAVPWFAWVWFAAATGHASSAYYTDYFVDWRLVAGSVGAKIVALNAFLILIGPVRSAIAGTAPLALLVHAACGVGAWAAVARGLRQMRPASVFLGAYAVVIVAWPWPPARFLVSVLPLVIGHLASLAKTAAIRALPPRIYRYPLAAVAIAALASNVVALKRDAELNRRYGFPYFVAPAAPAAWSEYELLFRWLRDNTAPSDVIAAGLDTLVSLSSDRRAFRPFPHRPHMLFYGVQGPPTGTADELLAVLRQRNVRFLVDTPLPGFSEEASFRAVIAELEQQPGALTVVHRGTDPRFKVYAVTPQ